MSSIRHTPRASNDLIDIWLFIANDSISAADRLLRRIASECEKLARRSARGRPRDELGAGIRSWSVGNYVVYYRIQADVIEILRVLSGFRDVASEFDE